MQKSAESAFPETAAAIHTGATSDVSPEPERLLGLIRRLRQKDLSALGSFDASSPQLRPLLEASAFEGVRSDLDGLHFAGAVESLEAIRT
jgi:hypothetical protein